MLSRIEIGKIHLAQDRMQPEGVQRGTHAMAGEIHQPDDQAVTVVAPQTAEVAAEFRRGLEMPTGSTPDQLLACARRDGGGSRRSCMLRQCQLRSAGCDSPASHAEALDSK